MGFPLSQRSLDRLEGVNPDMIRVGKKASELTTINYGVIWGMRTIGEQ